MATITAVAREVRIERFGGALHLYCGMTDQKIAQVDLVRGYGHYTGVGAHRGVNAVIEGGLTGVLAALKTGIRGGRDDRN